MLNRAVIEDGYSSMTALILLTPADSFLKEACVDLQALNGIISELYGDLTAFSCVLRLSSCDESGDKTEKPVADRL